MLISDLSASPSLSIVERARLQDVLDELELGRSRKLDQATVSRIGKLLGARYLVVGSYFDLLGSLRIDARAIETETGKVLTSVGARGRPDDFLELEQKLAQALGESLAKVTPPAPTPASESESQPMPAAKPPPKPPKRLPAKVAVRYSEALDAIDRKDKPQAQRSLEAVLKEQPDFLLASVELNELLH
jgi:TolB-like protein